MGTVSYDTPQEYKSNRKVYLYNNNDPVPALENDEYAGRNSIEINIQLQIIGKAIGETAC